MDLSHYRFSGQGKFKIQDYQTADKKKKIPRETVEKTLSENIEIMSDLQDKLYAQGKYGILIIFQAMDTAGKDGAIKHVMSGLNPQGTHVHSFKQPSSEELRHDYLWRASKRLPERGQIGIFNRSYYEEVLVVKVHELIHHQNIPEKLIGKDIWVKRYRQINDYEKHLTENGFVIIKFFLHLSKEEQKKRLLERIENASKNWKFSDADIKERSCWDQYKQCNEAMIKETGTPKCPWYIIPADKKWYARLLISEIIIQRMKELKLSYPSVSKEQLKVLEQCRISLEKE